MRESYRNDRMAQNEKVRDYWNSRDLRESESAELAEEK